MADAKHRMDTKNFFFYFYFAYYMCKRKTVTHSGNETSMKCVGELSYT